MRAGGGLQDPLAVVFLLAAHRYDTNARAEPAHEIGQRLFVAAGRDDASSTHAQRDGHRRAAKASGGAVDQHGFSGLQLGGEEAAIRHQQRAQRTPPRGVRFGNAADPYRVFRRHPHLPGPCAIVKISLQPQTAFAAGRQALQRDVGRQRVIARAHGRIAIDPVALGQMGRIRTGGADAADRAGTRHDRQFEQVFSFAAQDFIGVGENPARHHVDDHFAGAEAGIGQGFDRERRSELFQDGGFHGASFRNEKRHFRNPSFRQQDLVLS